MNIIGYSIELQSLINRYTMLIIVRIVSAVLLLAALWILPYIEIKLTTKPDKHKSKRKLKKEKEYKKALLYLQVFVTIFFIPIVTFFVYDDVKTQNTLKADVSQNAISVYVGDAELIYPSFSSIYDFIVDHRIVQFENSDEHYWIDMSRVNEGWNPDSGEFYGKITYGANSKYILKIE
ncbi:MAG: hypothetical protein E7538_04015 [Ruminococcaceae bacterium]|nr:hypothetical protein [Oscillospiraceae bacterium]